MRITDHTLDVPKFERDIGNYQGVCIGNADEDGIAIVTILSPAPVMSREQALIHAAWLVVLADESENCENFRRILRAVLET